LICKTTTRSLPLFLGAWFMPVMLFCLLGSVVNLVKVELKNLVKQHISFTSMVVCLVLNVPYSFDF
jgi:hypothetical protein